MSSATPTSGRLPSARLAQERHGQEPPHAHWRCLLPKSDLTAARVELGTGDSLRQRARPGDDVAIGPGLTHPAPAIVLGQVWHMIIESRMAI